MATVDRKSRGTRFRRPHGSKQKLQAELDLPRRRSKAGDLTGPLRPDLARKCSAGSRRQKFAGCGQKIVGRIEVRTVECVEHLRPELYLHRLMNGKVLEQGEVEVVEGRPTQNALARAAVVAQLGERTDLAGHHLESVWVEPKV